MDAESQPAPRKNKAVLQKLHEIALSALGAIVILGCLYAIARLSNKVDLFSPTTTAVGGFVTCLALLWPLAGRVTGPGALHQEDAAQGSQFIASAGVVITIGGVLADDHLGLPGLGIVALAAFLSFIALIAVFFGLATRRQRLEDEAASKADPATNNPADSASEPDLHH